VKSGVHHREANLWQRTQFDVTSAVPLGVYDAFHNM